MVKKRGAFGRFSLFLDAKIKKNGSQCDENGEK
jgi:hypothetical protein